MLLMLVEWLEQAGINVVSANTDSLDIIFDKSKEQVVRDLMKRWTEMTNGITMGEDDIAKAVYSDVNCYFWQETNGAIKEKGRWVTHYDDKGEWKPKMLNKGFRHPVINIALRDFFLKDKPIEDTIYNHEDILDFCMSQKVDRSFTVWHNRQKQQRINRWYASTDGAYIYKEKDGKYGHMLKSSGVTILNHCTDRYAKNYSNLNYQWYVSQCQKQIDEVIPKQMKLF